MFLLWRAKPKSDIKHKIFHELKNSKCEPEHVKKMGNDCFAACYDAGYQ